MAVSQAEMQLYCTHFFLRFFFNDTATTEIYTLSLHDALPISRCSWTRARSSSSTCSQLTAVTRSEEHTSELQSQFHLVCRLLLEKKNSHDSHRQNRSEACANMEYE